MIENRDIDTFATQKPNSTFQSIHSFSDAFAFVVGHCSAARHNILLVKFKDLFSTTFIHGLSCVRDATTQMNHVVALRRNDLEESTSRDH